MVGVEHGADLREREEGSIDLELPLTGVFRKLVDVPDGVAAGPKLFDDEIGVNHLFHPPARFDANHRFVRCFESYALTILPALMQPVQTRTRLAMPLVTALTR